MIEGDGVFNNYEESESELGALGYKHGDLSEGEDNTIMQIGEQFRKEQP